MQITSLLCVIYASSDFCVAIVDASRDLIAGADILHSEEVVSIFATSLDKEKSLRFSTNKNTQSAFLTLLLCCTGTGYVNGPL